MKNKEAAWCRGPMAAALNKLGVWLPFPNISYLLGTDAYRGRPDGEYRSPEGHVIDVEFKAAVGSLFLGDQDDPSNTEGFHVSQREWHRLVSARSPVPYALVLFAYTGDPGKRMQASKGAFYVVSPREWNELQGLIHAVNPEKKKNTAAIAKGSERLLAYRHISLEEQWSSWRYASAEEAAYEVHRRCNHVHRRLSDVPQGPHDGGPLHPGNSG